MEKKHMVIVGSILILGIGSFLGWTFMHKTDDAVLVPNTSPSEKTGSIATFLAQQAGASGENNTGEMLTEVVIDETTLAEERYPGGGEYRVFSSQDAKKALVEGKSVMIYFFDPASPSDQALQKDIQTRIDRIPARSILFHIDYPKNKTLAETFHITHSNTVIFLTQQGNERTRRSVGLTKLSQIVQALHE